MVCLHAQQVCWTYCWQVFFRSSQVKIRKEGENNMNRRLERAAVWGFNMVTVRILPYLSGAGKSVTADSRWGSFPIITIHKHFLALLDSYCRPQIHQRGPGRVAKELWHWSLYVTLKSPAGCLESIVFNSAEDSNYISVCSGFGVISSNVQNQHSPSPVLVLIFCRAIIGLLWLWLG